MLRGQHQEAPLTEETGSLPRGQGNVAELWAADVGDAVVLGELFIEERVVRAPEFDRVTIVTQLAEQEQLGLFWRENRARKRRNQGNTWCPDRNCRACPAATMGKRSARRRFGRDHQRAFGGFDARERRGRSGGCAARLEAVSRPGRCSIRTL